jgi:hypothetical protein
MEPIAWLLSLKDAQRAWKQGGYPHEKRNALRIPKVREILNEHIEDWDRESLNSSALPASSALRRRNAC